MRWKTDECTLARSNIEHYRPMMNWKSLWSSSRPLHVRRSRRCDTLFSVRRRAGTWDFVELYALRQCAPLLGDHKYWNRLKLVAGVPMYVNPIKHRIVPAKQVPSERMSSLKSDRSCLFLAINQTCSFGLGSLRSTNHVSTAFTSHRFRSAEKVSRAECSRSLSSPTVAVLSRNTRSTAVGVSQWSENGWTSRIADW